MVGVVASALDHLFTSLVWQDLAGRVLELGFHALRGMLDLMTDITDHVSGGLDDGRHCEYWTADEMDVRLAVSGGAMDDDFVVFDKGEEWQKSLDCLLRGPQLHLGV